MKAKVKVKTGETDLLERENLGFVEQLLVDALKEVLVDQTDVERRTKLQLIVPLATDASLIGDERPLTKLPLTKGMHLQLGEELSEGVDSFVGPMMFAHQGNERVLCHGHLAKAELGIRDHILGGLKG